MDFNQYQSRFPIMAYKLVLVPHPELGKHIAEIRKEFNSRFSVENPTNSLPQVLLAQFSQIKPSETRIVNRLRIVAMASHAFRIELKGFGSFPTHSIFINVSTKIPIAGLIKKIKTDTQRLMRLDAEHKPYFPADSHIAVGLKLKPRQYEKAWLEFEKRHFTGKFIADHMLLLRKEEGEMRYKPIETFRFENLPVDTRQGELF